MSCWVYSSVKSVINSVIPQGSGIVWQSLENLLETMTSIQSDGARIKPNDETLCVICKVSNDEEASNGQICENCQYQPLTSHCLSRVQI